jgi:anaerobic selenocysteine-containing dehydrogenase
MQALGIKEGAAVDLVSEYDKVKRTAHNFLACAYPIPTKCAATYFPEANVLVPIAEHDPASKTPASKSIVIRVVPAER